MCRTVGYSERNQYSSNNFVWDVFYDLLPRSEYEELIIYNVLLIS